MALYKIQVSDSIFENMSRAGVVAQEACKALCSIPSTEMQDFTLVGLLFPVLLFGKYFSKKGSVY